LTMPMTRTNPNAVFAMLALRLVIIRQRAFSSA
jgi:hypothetical protein